MANTDLTRRALLGGLVGAAAGGGLLHPEAASLLRRFAPFGGSAPAAARREVPDEVGTPHGPAEVRYDDYGVPHVSAGDDAATYYALGFVQAADRLFQMELQRRSMRGTLSEVVGEATVDADEFNRRMDFTAAAEANWDAIGDTETGAVVEAYVDGVNRYLERETLPLEFGLLDFEPEPWTPVDSMLMEKQISWGLTGGFATLRRNVVAGELGDDLFEELYPRRMDHDSPIIRRGETGGEETGDLGSPGGAGAGGSPADPDRDAGDVRSPPSAPAHADVGRELLDWLGAFESPTGVGSNSWVVSGEHTASGSPVVCNDPHLTLMVPPVWYEIALEPGDREVAGVTFPGVPFVVIGGNDAGAWGFTNTGADVIDFYSYETRTAGDTEQYRYRGEWRDYDEETVTIAVDGGENREITRRKTVHGPVLEREGQEVGVAWTGLSATRTTLAVHEYAHSDGMADVLAATEGFDLPTQNLVYADRDGNTLYYVTGRIPDRRVDGEQVRGDRVFDGSTGEAEWQGYTPYGDSSWEGFVPFEEKPHVLNPDVLGTANQRIVDDPAHYVAEGYAPPFRGERVYERLDARVASEDPVDPEFMADVQADTHDGRAERLVPVVLDATGEMSEPARTAAETLSGWEFRMDRDSRAALVFARWFEAYREALFADAFEAMDLDASYWPNDWVVATLAADSPWFERLGRSRAAVVAGAMEAAVESLDEGATYGDENVVDLDHPFAMEFLAYPDLPMDGSSATVKNFRADADVGSSWRMVVPMADGESATGVLPGGNSGDYFSEHYHDQLRMWTNGEYTDLPPPVDGDADVAFVEEP